MAVENVTYTGDDLNAELMDVLLPVTVFFITLAVFGIFGNASVFLVFKFRYPQCNFRYFVLFISVIDFVSCLTTIPAEIYSEFNWFDFRNEALCKLKSLMNTATILPESCILLLISVDRYRKVCRPLGRQLSPRQSLKICIGVCVFGVAISFLTLIVWGKQNYVTTFRGQEVRGVLCEKAEEYKNSVLPTVLALIFYIVPCMVNMIAMSIFCVLIGIRLFCSKTSLGYTQHIRSIQRSRALFPGKDFEDSVTTDVTPTPQSPEDVTGSGSNLKKVKCNMENGLDRGEEENGPKHLEIANKETGGNSSQNVAETGKHTSMRLKNSEMREEGGDLEQFRHTEARGDEISGSKPVRPETNLRSGHRMKGLSSNVIRRTLISFVLTAVFVITMTIYFSLVNFFGKWVLRQSLSPTETRTLFFFFRLYFINSVINPIVYGFLDARFKAAFMDLFRHLLRRSA